MHGDCIRSSCHCPGFRLLLSASIGTFFFFKYNLSASNSAEAEDGWPALWRWKRWGAIRVKLGCGAAGAGKTGCARRAEAARRRPLGARGGSGSWAGSGCAAPLPLGSVPRSPVIAPSSPAALVILDVALEKMLPRIYAYLYLEIVIQRDVGSQYDFDKL